ncbi:MAG: hypothetical protein WCG47_16155 [Dermatophilaceae bacterium]
MDQTTLEGMPEPAVLRLHASDGQVLVMRCRSGASAPRGSPPGGMLGVLM